MTTQRYMHMAPSVLVDAVSLLEQDAEWQQRGKTKNTLEEPECFKLLM